MDDLNKYRNRFTGKGLRILNQAIDDATSRGQNYVSLSHLFKALKNEEPWLFDRSPASFKIEPPLTDELLEKLIADAPRYAGEGIRIAPEANWLFRHAQENARAHHSASIEVIDLIGGLLEGLRSDPPLRSSDQAERNIEFSFKMANQEYVSQLPL